MKLLLNFISPQQEKNLNLGHLCLLLKNIFGVILLLSLIISIIAIPLNIRNEHLNKLYNLKNEAAAQIDDQTVTDDNGLNKKIETFNKIQNEYYDLSEILKTITTLVPEGITINRLKIDQENLIIFGKADTRQQLLSFKELLEKSGIFSEIKSPINNYLAENNVNFEISGKIKQ